MARANSDLAGGHSPRPAAGITGYSSNRWRCQYTPAERLRPYAPTSTQATASNREQSDRAGLGRPVSRATLAELMQISPHSQRAYERVAGVRRHPNWAIGPAQAEAPAQELSWQHGQSLFTFTDRRGHYGRPGARYLAWQLPNSYQGPHQTQGRRHQKALNQQLVDLYSKGFTGTGKQQAEEEGATAASSRFYDNGQAAVRALNRGLQHDAYWRTERREKQYQIWHILPASEARS